MTTKNSKPAESTATTATEPARPARPATAQEAEAVARIKDLLASGKAGIASAVESIMTQPWIVGVDAITQSWPDLKVTARKHLLTGLAAQQNEQGRRFRMSLGRGLLNHDADAALKMIDAVCAEMWPGENGEPSQKDRQIFANVLIGKGKPWLLHLPVADLKPAAADRIILCAVATCFPGQCPPFTQLSVLRWIVSAGRLSKLPAASLESIAKAVKRWQPKLRDDLKRDASELPAPIMEALNTAPVVQPQPAAPAPERERQQKPERRERTEVHPAPSPRQPAPAPAQAHAPRAGRDFDLVSALRQIEAHVNTLKSELARARTEPRQQRGDSGGRGRRADYARTPEQEPVSSVQLDELQRHNTQLEETITDLRQRLEDLSSDHEDIATSMRAHEETPLTDEKEQFKALLAIKLQPDYAEFRELDKLQQDEVYKEPFRLLLNDIFKILESHGIALNEH